MSRSAIVIPDTKTIMSIIITGTINPIHHKGTEIFQVSGISPQSPIHDNLSMPELL